MKRFALILGLLICTSLHAADQTCTDNGFAKVTTMGVSGAVFASADQSADFASVTDAPNNSARKLVIVDLIVSVDTAMRVDFAVESNTGTVIKSFYMPANSGPVNVLTRAKLKLATANKKLQVKTSTAGNITVEAHYYSE